MYSTHPAHTLDSNSHSLRIQRNSNCSQVQEMTSEFGGKRVDLWSEIIAEEEPQLAHRQLNNNQVFYRRRRTQITPNDVILNPVDSFNKENRVSVAAPVKRVSWNRSLSTRGRTSIAVAACVDSRPKKQEGKRRGRPPVPKAKATIPLNFEKEQKYFQEVDAFELLEESPSPKNISTWTKSDQTDAISIPHLSSRLEKWLISRKLNYSCGPSSTLSKILGTPAMTLQPICDDDINTANLKTPEKLSIKATPHTQSIQSRVNAYFLSKELLERGSNSHETSQCAEECDDIDAAIKKLSLASTSSSLVHDHGDPFSTLLAVCEQAAPSTLLDVFSKYCDPESIVKVGEGTYGEALKAGNTVCKIVPVDGDIRVNGEVQKRSEELLEEVLLSRTLNYLRHSDSDARNACTTFIETLDLRVCQGPYDRALIRAWEDWDDKHGSENDHPKQFPEKQCYVVFVLRHGGKDLESFVLLNFDEAQSLLVQVTAALAVAEAAFEFEHRDLHWGNILLKRDGSATTQFTLDGRRKLIRTSGLLISIIDFTLSRINTGDDILFLDLSSDPYIFKGPRGDRQAETYRKMKEVTEDFWQGSFPRTNVLWLMYLVDILLLKKSFERTTKNERDLRALKKRLDKYNSAKEAIFDPFFGDLIVEVL